MYSAKSIFGRRNRWTRKKVNGALFPEPLLYNDARKWTSALFPFIGLNKRAPGYSFDIFPVHNDICNVPYSPKKTTYYVLLVFL